MPRLSLFFLGPPRIERDGATVKVDTRKATALLAYLSLTGESHRRDELAALLWPELERRRGLAALRRTLSTLNRSIGREWLKADRQTIGLKGAYQAYASGHSLPHGKGEPNSLWMDVAEFGRLLATCRTHGHAEAETCAFCLPLLADASSLYRDDFLAGFGLQDSPAFDEWQTQQAERLRRRLMGALERLVSGHKRQGEFEAAITYGRRWLAVDPLQEPAHRQLMMLYVQNGERAAALRQYQECVQVLDRELGVAPSDETTQLYHDIVENRLSKAEPDQEAKLLPAAPFVTTDEPRLLPWTREADYPMVGRSAEWETLLQAYADTDGDGRFIALEGEAGIGKTRLAAAFLEYVREQGGCVVAACCYEGETNLAYAPFIDGVRAVIRQPDRARLLVQLPLHWLSEVARLLPELASWRSGLSPGPALESPGAWSRFYEGMNQLLMTVMAGASPGVLFIDDVHWADEASLDLLTYLVRRWRQRPLIVLVTWRDKGVPSGHRLRQLVVETQRAGRATHLLLPRLDRAMAKEFVDSAVVPARAELADKLYQKTEGLPLFLVEYVRLVNDKGADVIDRIVPESVRDLLRVRLATVGEVGRQLLSAASVIGRSFDFDTLRQITGYDDETIVMTLESLLAQGLIAQIDGNGKSAVLLYDFNHEQLRTLIYMETDQSRRRILHRRVAEVLSLRLGEETALRTAPYLSRIAYHYRLAGRQEEAAEYFKAAGEQARAVHANSEALMHFREALALDHAEKTGLCEAIGDVQKMLGDYDAALASYKEAVTLSSPETLASLQEKLGRLYDRRGDWEQAERHFEKAVAAQQDENSVGARARLYADWSLALYHRQDIERAFALAKQGLSLAEETKDNRALAQAYNVLGILANHQGHLEQAQRHLRRSLHFAQDLDEPAARAAALNNLAFVHSARGEPDRALELTRSALALCTARGDRHREAALHNNLADLLYAAGESDAAMFHVKQAVTIYAEIGMEADAVQMPIWDLKVW